MEIETSIVLAGFAGMTAAVTALWHVQRRDHTYTMQKLEQCEGKHEQATQTLIELSEKVGRLQGIEEMSDRVLDEVKASNARLIEEIREMKNSA